MNLINEIVIGDILKVLKEIPDNSFDLGVTSPPYNKQKNRKGVLVKDIKYSDITDNINESEYQIEQIEILNELYRVVKPGGSFFYNHHLRTPVYSCLKALRELGLPSSSLCVRNLENALTWLSRSCSIRGLRTDQSEGGIEGY